MNIFVILYTYGYKYLKKVSPEYDPPELHTPIVTVSPPHNVMLHVAVFFKPLEVLLTRNTRKVKLYNIPSDTVIW